MDKQRLIEKRIIAQHRIIAERLISNPAQILGLARGNLKRWAAKYDQGEQPPWIGQWMQLLNCPLETVVKVLTSGSEEACRLRSSSPFAGVLSARERWALYREIRDET